MYCMTSRWKLLGAPTMALQIRTSEGKSDHGTTYTYMTDPKGGYWGLSGAPLPECPCRGATRTEKPRLSTVWGCIHRGGFGSDECLFLSPFSLSPIKVSQGGGCIPRPEWLYTGLYPQIGGCRAQPSHNVHVGGRPTQQIYIIKM